MNLKYLWPWKKVKVIKPGMTPTKVIIMQTLLEKCTDIKGNVKSFFQMKKYVCYLPWSYAKIKNSDIFMINLT